MGKLKLFIKSILREKSISRLACVLYVCAFVALTFKTVSGGSFLDLVSSNVFPYKFIDTRIDYYLEYLLFVVLVLNTYLYRTNVWKLVIIVVLGFVVQKDFLTNDNMNLVYLFWFIIAYPADLRLKTMAKCAFFTISFFVLLVLALHFTGQIPERTQFQHGVERHSYGFTWPNNLSYYTTVAIFSWCYAFSDRWSKGHIFFALIVLISAFVVANGRIAFILGLLMVLFTSLYAKRSRFQSVWNRVSNAIFKLAYIAYPILAVCCLVLVVVCVNFDAAYRFVYPFLTARIELMTQFVDQYGLALFGQDIKLVSYRTAVATGQAWSNIDNLYVYSALQYGLMFVLLFVILNMALVKVLKRREDVLMAFLVLLMALCGVTENLPLLPVVNLAIFAIGSMLSRAESKEDLYLVQRAKHAKPPA